MAEISLELLKTEIISSLEKRLSGEPSWNAEVIADMVEDAIEEVKKARRYPSTYSTEQIITDLYLHKPQIKKICIYDFNRDGADGQNIHSENNVYRGFEDRKKCFSGILPISSF